MKKLLLAGIITVLLITSGFAAQITLANEKEKNRSLTISTENTKSDSVKTYDFPQIDVIGKIPSLFNKVPGSAYLITSLHLDRTRPLTGNEIMRKVSGVHVVDEEGLGLRTNIGIRGLDPDRSRTVLMMEDGIPIALAPYGEPEMYYTPSIDRMKRVEVLKGSGSILFGPQTIGGVINYITADPPVDPSASLNLRGGKNGFFTGQISYGSTYGTLGFNVNYLHRRADKIGTTNFEVNDVSAKVRFSTGSNSRIGVKIGIYDEVSNSTYVGLTQSMFDNGEYYTIIAPFDRFNISRLSASLTHDLFISESTLLRTTVYGYKTKRNWQRQDFSRSPNPSRFTGVVFGDTTIAGGALYMRNSTGNRNRQFEVAGIEPRISFNYNIGNLFNEFEGGVRFLFERAIEQRVNGQTADASDGRVREDEIRTGYAYSAHFLNRIFFTEQISVTPGVRVEQFNYEREIFRLSYRDTSLAANSELFSVVPGIGLNYNFSNNYTLFAGIHRGFAPPRIKDAITNGGVPLQLEAELSWNSELGMRANPLDYFAFEITAYVLDFSNQIIPVSESSGGSGSGFVNGGRTIHRGIETGVRFDIGKILNTDFGLQLSSNATFSKSEYNADRFIKSGNDLMNIKGYELPYAPKFYLSNTIDLQFQFGLGLSFSGTYVGKQFSDELNTVLPSPSGEIGIIPSHLVFDITGRYSLDQLNSSVYLSVKNLTDERYIASRRPQGIKVGLPRLLTAGIEVNL